MDRRRFVATTSIGVAGLAVGCVSTSPDEPKPTDAGRAPGDAGVASSDAGSTPVDAGSQGCSTTGADIEGPYYRAGVPVRSELNLYGEEGEALTLQGTVTDASCAPIANAVVEIWHADPQGGYDTASQEKRYYGQASTDAEGFYAFSTLMPGRYLNGEIYRPAHIHMKVFVGTQERLTTQIYFDGDPFSAGDAFFEAERSVPVEQGTAVFAVTV